MTSFNFIIRDALADDIAECLALDHSYETEHVWQMVLQAQTNGWMMSLRTERLPRSVEFTCPSSADRLQASLDQAQGYLIAIGKEDPTLLGYCVIHHERAQNIAILHDLLVSRPYRRAHVGARLLSVARRWAQEQGASQLHIATQTKNYPAIQFALRQGFTFCGFNDHYFPNGDIAVFFNQPLR